MIGFIDTYTFTQSGAAGSYNAIAILHTSQFTVTHALGFSVYMSRILATDLSQSHCNLKSHIKSSWHRLIPFLPFLQLPIPRLNSMTLDYFCILRCTPSTTTTPVLPNISYSYFARTSLKTHPVLLTKPVYPAVV
jgi:hypothetical protein